MKIKSIKHYFNGFLAYRNFSRPPIIIGGCERSGTSLLQSIMSAHPNIHAIAEETWAFCYGPYAGFKGNKPIRIWRLYKALGKSKIPSSSKRWCEKTPANVFYFDSIIDYFSGQLKLIYIVRDGRDVITSIHPTNPSQPWVSIERWLDVMEKGHQYMNHDLILTIKYEELINNFSNTIKLICEHIGEPVSAQVLDWHRYATITQSENLIGKQVKELSANSIKKYSSTDFEHRHLVDELMQNERAQYFLRVYDYI